jgi:hypothetical protein
MSGRGAGRDPADTLRVTVGRVYGEKAEGLTETQAAALGADVDAYLEVIRASARDDPAIDVGLAERLAAACHGLLDRYPELGEKDRRSVIGAVRYFIEPEDAERDLESPKGLEDDAELVNFVIALTRAGIPMVEVSE